MAEGMGFEPTIPVSQYNGLAIRRLQPLGHPSADHELGSYRLRAVLLVSFVITVNHLF